MAEEILLNYSLDQDMLQRVPDQRILARLDIEPGPDLQQQADIACDIVLVLDCSGSMDGAFNNNIKDITKRQGVIQATKNILPNLGPQDTVSIIFYASQAYHIATALPANQPDVIERHIESLTDYSGGTNFEAALKMTQQVIKSCPNVTKRVLFLTDGNANYGKPESINQMVSELAQQGVTIDSMGVGKDFNFSYMRNLSKPSNGFSELLDAPDNANALFESLLVNTQRTVANNVFLSIMFPAGIRDIELYQQVPEMRYYTAKLGQDGISRIELNIQTLRRDKRNIYILKANIDAPTQDNNQKMAEIRLDFDIPSLNLTRQREACNIFVNFTDQKTHPMRDTSVDNLYYEAELTKLYSQFVEIKDQDWQKAVALLQEMIQRVNTLGDNERLTFYQQALTKLQKDKQLSNDDLNRIGQSSSRSTQQQLADIIPPSAQASVLDY